MSPAKLDRLKDAVRRLRELGVYDALVNMHTMAAHQNEMFLPWHRAYLLEFEFRVIDLGPKFRRFAMPYWDWTMTRDIPEPYKSNTNNPLYWKYRTPGQPRDLPTAEDVKRLLQINDFGHFGGFRTLDGCPQPAESLGDLQIGVHDRVHLWVGGGDSEPSMRNLFRSPNDPIFWIHHANVDRIWALWQGLHNGGPVRNGDSLPNFHGSSVGSRNVGDMVNRFGWGVDYALAETELIPQSHSNSEQSFFEGELVPNLATCNVTSATLKIEGIRLQGHSGSARVKLASSQKPDQWIEAGSISLLSLDMPMTHLASHQMKMSGSLNITDAIAQLFPKTCFVKEDSDWVRLSLEPAEIVSGYANQSVLEIEHAAIWFE